MGLTPAICLDNVSSNYLKAMSKKLALNDACLGRDRDFKVGGEHGGWVVPWHFSQVLSAVSGVPVVAMPVFVGLVPPVPAKRAESQLMPVP